MTLSLSYALLISLFSCFYLVLILFFHRGLKRLTKGTNTERQKVSIIIAARNEETRIIRCLNSVLMQDYPHDWFEVIVVNDRSSDSTRERVESLLPRRRNLILMNVEECPPGISPKKYALAQGIVRSSGEILVFTDADCIVPRTWIRTLVSHFTPEIGVVAGLTTYLRPASMPQLFWGLQAMDFFSHAVVSAAGMGIGFPLNTNANNFALRKNVYTALNGFKQVASIVSGDDDLLLQAAAKSGRYQIRYAPESTAAVETEPTPTLRGIWEQRKRWSSKTVYYNPAQVRVLSSVFIFYSLILFAFPLSIFLVSLLPWALGAFLIKTGLDFSLAYRGMKSFGKDNLVTYFIPMALLHIPLIVFSCLFGVFGKFAWKDGRVRKRLNPSAEGNNI